MITEACFSGFTTCFIMAAVYSPAFGSIMLPQLQQQLSISIRGRKAADLIALGWDDVHDSGETTVPKCQTV